MPPRLVRPQNLIESFRIAAQEYRQKPVYLTNNQKVKLCCRCIIILVLDLRTDYLFSSSFQAARLYRQSLKTLCSWVVDRRVFNDEADLLRARFDANRGLPPTKAISMIEQGEDELFTFSHPDPYVRSYMPGGSGFMRSSPLPKEVCFPDGDYPADFPNYTVNADMTICKPETGKAAVGSVLIDFTKKNME